MNQQQVEMLPPNAGRKSRPNSALAQCQRHVAKFNRRTNDGNPLEGQPIDGCWQYSEISRWRRKSFDGFIRTYSGDSEIGFG